MEATITREVQHEKWPKPNPKKPEEFLAQMRETISDGAEWWRENWERARLDLEFAYGEQWPDQVRNDADVSRMMLTLNMLPQLVHQVVGNAKKSSFGIRVSQIGGPLLSPAPLLNNSKRLTMSEVMESIIRDIEYRSHAPYAYAQALQHAVESGFGWLRIVTQRAEDDPWVIEPTIEHVLDRWSVVLDPWSGKSDFSDAGWGAVMTVIPRKLFMQEYPKAMAAGGGDYYWGNTMETARSFWQPTDGIRLVEFFWKEPRKRTAVRLELGDGQLQSFWLDEIEMVVDELQAGGIRIVDEMKVDTHQVKWIKATSHDILAGPKTWAGQRIPLIPVFGREIHRQRTREFAGIIRWAKDPQLMRNHWFSAATERITMIPVSPYVMTVEQIEGHEEEWTKQGSDLKMALTYNADEDAPGPPQRQQPAPMPIGELALMEQGTRAVHDATGIHQPYIGAKSNETSGRAILARQQEGDTGTYDFIWGLGKAITATGEQLVQIIPRIFSGSQVAHLVLPDETGAFMPLNYPIVDEDTGITVHMTPLALGRYSCRIDMGPGFMTAQREFLDFVLQWQQSDPQGFQMIKHKVIQALDIPNKNEIARILMHNIPRELLSPEEQEQIAEPQPSQADMMMAQLEQMKLEAEMAKAESASLVAQTKVEIEQMRLRQEQIEAGRGGGVDDAAIERAVTRVIQRMRQGRAA